MKYLIILLFIFQTSVSNAQSQKDLVIKEMQSLANRYKTASFLSFDAYYKYATEESPNIYLDSLEGQYKLNGSNFWYRLDNSQTMYNGQYLIAVFKEDDIIYINKPDTSSLPKAPLTLIDSAIAKRDIEYEYTKWGKTTIITLNFINDPKIKRIQYEVDNKTGWINKMIQVVSSDQMINMGTASTNSSQETFSIIETTFDNYKQKSFSDEAFKSEHYFSKQNNQYFPSASYSSYKVFLGNTQL